MEGEAVMTYKPRPEGQLSPKQQETAERLEKVRKLITLGLKTPEIAARMGLTRNIINTLKAKL